MERHDYWIILIGLLILLSTGAAVVSAGVILPDSNGNTSGNAQVRATMHSLPLSFIENQGQAPGDVKFHVAAAGHTISFTSDGLVLRTTPENEGNPVTAEVRMDFVRATSSAIITGIDPLPGKANFLIGNDSAKWEKDVPTFSAIKYEQIYRGIDLVYRGTEGVLKREFVVSPGANPDQILFSYSGVDSIAIAEDGSLNLATPLGVITDEAPVAYQLIGDQKVPVTVSYNVDENNLVGFTIGPYDRSKPLIIDPSLKYSTYLGGVNGSTITGVAVDSDGNAYVTGYTSSTDFPTVNPLQASISGTGTDIFVTKINPAGSALVYSTFIGGTLSDYGYNIAIDAPGNAYITGYTKSVDFPTMNPLQPALNGTTQDAFVFKLNPSGSSLVYSTYLGGTSANTEYGYGIAVDNEGNAIVSGITNADGFPVVNASQQARGGGIDLFVTKISPDGSRYIYSTYLGGTLDEGSTVVTPALAGDSDGNAYVVSSTKSNNFPVLNAYQPTFAAGTWDGVITKYNPTGSVVFSTYLGGTGQDRIQAVAVDSSHNLYLSGLVAAGFPTLNPIQAAPVGSPYNSFITKMDASGQSLIYSTFWGNGQDSGVNDIALDSDGNAYVVGSTSSTTYPMVNPIQGALKVGDKDLYIYKMNAAGTSVLYSTYLGSTYLDTGRGIAVDSAGNAYVVGTACAADFPLKNPLMTYSGSGTNNYDGVIAVISPLSLTVANFTAVPLSGISPMDVQFTDATLNDPTSWDWSFGDSTPNSTAQSPLHTYSSAGNFTVILTAMNGAGSSSLAKTHYINVTAPTPAIRFEPASPVITVGGTQHYNLIVSTLPSGLAGFNLTLSLANPSVGRITGFTPAGWMALNGSSTLPATSLTFNGVDLGRTVEAGATNVSIGTIDIEGISPGMTSFNIAVQKMDADGGAAINPLITPASLTVYQPLVADFTGDHTLGIESLLVNFTDLTSGSPSPSSWMWTFGDSSFATDQNPSHTYMTVGSYNVSLLVNNTYCGSTVTKNAYIRIVHYVEPFPEYTLPPTDTDGDFLCEDINGNGRLDFDDVVAFYTNMDWIRSNTNVGVAPFDYNGNGRIDYDDVVRLYLEVLNG